MSKEQSPNSSNISNEGEDLTYLIGLPISEVYLHGVIAGKDKLIKELQDKSTDSNKRIVELIEARKELAFQCANEETDELIKNIQYSTYLELSHLLTKLKQL